MGWTHADKRHVLKVRKGIKLAMVHTHTHTQRERERANIHAYATSY